MKHKKGFTLLEVVISLFIVSIVAVGFYSMFSTVFINTYKTSSMTEAVYAAQADVEDKILDVKTKINNNNILSITEPAQSVTVFGGTTHERLVEGYMLESGNSNYLLSSFVSRSRPEPLRIPSFKEGEDLEIFATTNGTNTVAYPNVGMTNLEIKHKDFIFDNASYLIDTIYQWYGSVRKVYVPFYDASVDGIDEESEELFVDENADLKKILHYTGKNIPNLSDVASFGGRFIKQRITPVGEKGSTGVSAFSNSVFISSFPITGNSVLMHLDASFIDLNDSAQMFGLNRGVKRWIDIGPNSTNYVNNENVNNAPVVHEEGIGEEERHGIFSLKNNGTTSSQTLVNTSSLSGQSLTVYIAINFEDIEPGITNKVIFDSNSNSTTNKFTITIVNNNQIKFTKTGNSTSSSYIRDITYDDYRTDAWDIYRIVLGRESMTVSNSLTSTTNPNTGVRSFSLSQIGSTVNTTSNTRNTNSIQRIVTDYSNGHRYGEIIVFDSSSSRHSVSDQNKVLEYLYDKYIGE